MSPTQRSLKNLRERGYMVAVVEKYNAHIKRRIDLWGFGDLLACRLPDEDGISAMPVIVQTTTASNMASRRTKIAESEEARFWKACGGAVLLHGWAKRPPLKGKKRIRVELKEEWI